MSSLKLTSPNLRKLEHRLKESFRAGITEFIARTKERRLIVIRNRRNLFTSLTFLVISILALPLVYYYFDGSAETVATMYLLGLGAGSVILGVEFRREQKILAQELNLALIPTITACFSRLALYMHDENHRSETESLLKQSGLLPEQYSSLVADDTFSFFEPYPISARELYITKLVGQSKTKLTKVFRGLFVVVDLPKTFTGVTALSTEGDKFGLNHLNFWGESLLAAGLKETTFEWNQFEADMHVATTNPVEAREILTPSVMEGLHEWWLEYGENIRVVFRENRMYILLPNNSIKIGDSTTSTDLAELSEYALSVIKPLWYALRLVEEVEV
jgi:hypothetical protein